MRTVTKKMTAGVSVLACLFVVITGILNYLPPATILKRSIIAAAIFGLATFIGGLIYEKIWLR